MATTSAMTRRWTLLGVVLLATQARAGGHFDVDDAGVLEPGECQNEIWGGHTTVKTVNFLHIGPSCRAGPVELGLNYDGLRATENRFDLVGPQLKWGFYGQEPGAVIAAALAFSAFHDVKQGGRWGGQWTMPVTWHVIEPVFVHANVGQDWEPGDGERSTRVGLGVEWVLSPQISLIGEQSRVFSIDNTRAGLRYSITRAISIDFSVARLGPNGVRSFVIGLNHEFKRP